MIRDRRMAGIPLLALLLTWWTPAALAQQQDWEVSFVLHQRFPPPYLGDWEGNPSIGSLLITNNTGVPAEVELFVTIGRTTGGILASGSSLPILIPPGAPTQISSDEFIDWNTVTYDGSVRDQAVRSGRLPEGNYQACVSVQSLDGMALAPVKCEPFTIVYPAPPSLFFPSDGDTITTEYPTFSWTPVQVPPAYQLRYFLRIAEVLPGQTSHQALAANITQYENQDLLLTTLQYPLDALALEPGKTYAWQIQGLDQNGYAPSSNDGRSEIWTFTFNPPAAILLDAPPPNQGFTLALVFGDSAKNPDPRAEGFVDTLKAMASTGRFVVALPGDGTSDTLEIPATLYIDTEKQSYAVTGEYRGTSVLFSGRWGMKNDPREKALALKLAEHVALFEGILSPRYVILSLGEFNITSEDLPDPVRPFYDSLSVGLKPGLNLHGTFDLGRYPRLVSLATMLRFEPTAIALKGYLTRGSKAATDLLKDDGFLTTESAWDLAVSATLPASPLLPRLVSQSEVELEIGATKETKQVSVPISPGSTINHLVDSSETKLRLKITRRMTVPLDVIPEDGFFGDRLADSLQFSAAYQVDGSKDEFKALISRDTSNFDHTLEFGVDNLVSLPLLDGVFEFHDPKLAVNLKTGAVKLSGEFDFGQFKKAGELSVELERGAADSTALAGSGEENIPPGGVPTPFKQAELLSTTQGADSGQASPPKKTSSWKPTVTFKFAKGVIIQAREVISALFNLTVNIKENLGELRDLVVTRSTATQTTTLLARTSFMNSSSTLLASRLRATGGRSGFLLGLKPEAWSLEKMYPGLALPGLENLPLSDLGIVFTDQELRASAAELDEESYSFYREIYKRDDFQLTLNPGLSLVATIPAENLDPSSPLIPLMEKLGIERGPLLLEGTLGTKVKDLRLLAKLPPMRPAGSPGWFKSGELALELTGQPSVGMVGSITVELQGDEVTFFVKTQAGRSGLILVGGMDSDRGWQSPLGIQWLTLNRAVLLLGLTPSGSIQLGLEGDMVVGEKEIRTAALIALNAATGVPTNVMFDGESKTGFGMSDLTDLQAKMAAASADGSGAARISLDAFPPLDLTEAKLKFAPKDSPELGIERGMAIGGTLLLRPDPQGPPSTLGTALLDIGDNGIIAKGDLPPLAIGPVSLKEATLDLMLTREKQHLIVRGSADMGFLAADVGVNFTKTNLEFDASGKIFGMFEADLKAQGAINFSKPALRVQGKMKNDFNEAITALLESGLREAASAKQASAASALKAAKDQLAKAVAARDAARKRWAATPLFPRDKKVAARKKWTAATTAAERERANVAARTVDMAKWDALSSALNLASQGTGSDRLVRVKGAEFSANLLKLKQGAVETMKMTLVLRGNEQTLSVPGWNFKDLKSSMGAAARSVVQYLFDTTK